MNRVIHREIEVAFSRNSQPLWFRITKWIIIVAGVYFFWGNEYFWPSIVFLFAIAIMLHFVWRFKTKGWTQSWFGWNYESNKPNN